MNKRIAAIVLLYFVLVIGICFVLQRYLSISDITGIGQLFFDILLFPTVIIGFLIAIMEFRKAQSKPELELSWAGDMAVDYEGYWIVLDVGKYNPKQYYLQLFVRNKGEVMASFYRIDFRIPRELSRINSDTHIVRWHRGDPNDSSSSINLEMTQHEFKSHGQFAIYPGEQIHIATLELHIFPQIQYPDHTKIQYSIVTDRTETQYGECKIKIRPENLEQKVSSDYLLRSLIVHEQPPSRK